MDKPLVSIIMNCYNSDQYLRDAIESVHAQTYSNWEIIFWDNGSTDKSNTIANSYDSRLKYFYTKKTSLLGTARKLATEQAKGKYLAFLDCDDLWYKDKLKKQIKIFEESEEELGIVYGGCEIIYEDAREKKIFQMGQSLPEGRVFDIFAKNDFIPFVSAVVSKKFFFNCGGFPVHLKHSTDFWIFAHLTHDYPVAALQELCCKYRVHSNNLSSSTSLRITGLQESIESLSSFLPEKAAKEGIAYYYVYLAILYAKRWNIFQMIAVLTRNNIWWLFIKYATKKIISF